MEFCNYSTPTSSPKLISDSLHIVKQSLGCVPKHLLQINLENVCKHLVDLLEAFKMTNIVTKFF